jgi:hypothetical protein
MHGGRKWRDVYKCNWHWTRPFPDEVAWKRLQHAVPLTSGKRVILACSSCREQSCAVLRAPENPESPQVGSSPILNGKLTSLPGGVRLYLQGNHIDVSAGPVSAPGLELAFLRPHVWRINSHLDPNTWWEIGPVEPIALAAVQRTLLVVSCAASCQPSVLRCYSAETPSRGGLLVWEFDVTERCSEMGCTPSVKMIKTTRSKCHLPVAIDTMLTISCRRHLIASVAFHDPPPQSSLRLAHFLILDLHTGQLERVLGLPDTYLGGFHGSLASLFDHEFAVSDNFIVSSGPAFSTLVWQFTSPLAAGPLYQLPYPLNLSEELPRYVSLCISECGKYVACATKESFWVFDMVEKSVKGYHKGSQLGHEGIWTLQECDNFDQPYTAGFTSLESGILGQRVGMAEVQSWVYHPFIVP